MQVEWIFRIFWSCQGFFRTFSPTFLPKTLLLDGGPVFRRHLSEEAHALGGHSRLTFLYRSRHVVGILYTTRVKKLYQTPRNCPVLSTTTSVTYSVSSWVCTLPISSSELISLLSAVSGRLDCIRVRNTKFKITPFFSRVTSFLPFISTWRY